MRAPTVKMNNPLTVRRAIQRLAGTALDEGSTPTFYSVKCSGLAASRLVQTNASKVLASVTDLTGWIAGVANEIDVTDDGDGTLTIGIVDPLIVGKGGTGVATLTDHGLLVGSGTDAITPLAAATNGQIPIGSTGADPVLAGITGTANRITVTGGAGSITLTTPQDTHTGARPTFADIILTACDVYKAGPTLQMRIDDTNYNIIMGGLAGDNDNGQFNLFLGYAAGRYNDTTGAGSEGDSNIYIGRYAGYGVSESNTGNWNIALGGNALYSCSSGYYNVAIGGLSAQGLTTGYSNVCIGAAAGTSIAGGIGNICIGRDSVLFSAGNYNTCIGYLAGKGVSGNSFSTNTIIGFASGLLLTTGSSNVFIGAHAGRRQTTNANRLIIDNQDRTSAADEQTKSLLYGVFNATESSQTLRVNAKVGIFTDPSGILHADQSSTTNAIPVLTLDQADVSEEFIRFIGTSANGVLTQSIVEAADVGTATLAGYVKVYVQDDGDQLTDQAYFMPVYTLAAP